MITSVMAETSERPVDVAVGAQRGTWMDLEFLQGERLIEVRLNWSTARMLLDMMSDCVGWGSTTEATEEEIQRLAADFYGKVTGVPDAAAA